MLQRQFQQQDIAKAIGKSPSAVSRELARNCNGRSREYRGDLASRKSTVRKKSKPKAVRFTPPMRAYVEAQLAMKYSPEQIVGMAAKEGVECVSHEWIYQHIWRNKKRGGRLHEDLRTRGKRYRKRGNSKDRRSIIPGRVDISMRPAIVEQRERFGDIELDTIIGKGHKGAILTINDRASGVLRMRKVDRKEASVIAAAAVQLLQRWRSRLHTATSDNGKEFAEHQRIALELDVGFYFARPYHSRSEAQTRISTVLSARTSQRKPTSVPCQTSSFKPSRTS